MEFLDFINSLSMGEKIKYFRNKLGITQKELANRLGYYNKEVISLIETDKRHPGVKSLADIVELLNADLSYFGLDKLNLGEKIEYLRESMGYTQIKFAEKIGIANSELSKIENNCTKPNQDKIIAIAHGLGISVYELKNFKLKSTTTKFNFESDKKDLSTLGEKIRYYRKSNNLTQEELGKKIGVSASYISALELNKAKKGINKYILYQISIALNQDITKYN